MSARRRWPIILSWGERPRHSSDHREPDLIGKGLVTVIGMPFGRVAFGLPAGERVVVEPDAKTRARFVPPITPQNTPGYQERANVQLNTRSPRCCS